MSKMNELLEFSGKTETLRQIAENLHWDQETMMPKGAVAQRSEWLALLEEHIHKRDSSPRVSEWLDAVAGTELSNIESAFVEKIGRAHKRACALPPDLPPRMARAVTRAVDTWKEARENDDIRSYLPVLAEIVALKREESDALAPSGDRYDALLDDFEPGMTSAQLDLIFGRLRPGLLDLRDRILGSRHSVPKFRGRFPSAEQLDLAMSLAVSFGYDFSRGRLDISAHPFTAGVSDDVRITTRVDELNPFDCLYSTMHEVGHAIYEQNVSTELQNTILGKGASLGVHESQSRIVENQIGRSREFTSWLYAEMGKRFGDFGIRDEGQFYAKANEVEEGFIRTEADEVQYNLHVMLRYDLERQLIDGSLDAQDAEVAWNTRFEEDFGYPVEKPSQGLLQDIHWSVGCIGYFPTYAIGNIFAGCLYDAMRNDIPELDANLAAGDIRPVSVWLKEKVQSVGAQYSPVETIERATGRQVSERYLLNYLRSKFGEIYAV